jgi:hypothetical protein
MPRNHTETLAQYCIGREKKACEHFGFAARHALKIIRRITSKDTRDAFEEIVRRVANGDVRDPEVISMLWPCRGYAIDKGDHQPAASALSCTLHLAHSCAPSLPSDCRKPSVEET